MALTEQQEKQLLAIADMVPGLNEKIKGLEPIAAKVPELEKTIAEKDQKIQALEKGQNTLTEDKSFTELKSKYPDVPETVLKALPADKREDHAKVLQEQALKLKGNTKTAKSPQDLWQDAGGISPTDETERLAKQKEAEKQYDAHKNSGDVFGMLQLRMGEFVAHARQALKQS